MMIASARSDVRGRCRGERSTRAPRAARDVVDVRVVARRGHDHDAGRCRVVHGAHRRIVLGAVGRAERHVDDVDVIRRVAVTVRVSRPVDRLSREARVACAPEHPERVDLSLGRDARADRHRRRVERCVVRAGVRRPIRVHARARRGAGHMAPVAVAVHRVRVGSRDRADRRRRGVGRVVRVAREVEAADDLRRRVDAARDREASRV